MKLADLPSCIMSHDKKLDEKLDEKLDARSLIKKMMKKTVMKSSTTTTMPAVQTVAKRYMLCFLHALLLARLNLHPFLQVCHAWYVTSGPCRHCCSQGPLHLISSARRLRQPAAAAAAAELLSPNLGYHAGHVLCRHHLMPPALHTGSLCCHTSLSPSFRCLNFYSLVAQHATGSSDLGLWSDTNLCRCVCCVAVLLMCR